MSEVSRLTEEPPSHSDQKYRNLFEAANDALMIFEPDQEIILDANRRAVEIYGYSRETLIGMSLKNLTMDVSRGEALIERTLREGQIRDLETVHYHQDGRPINMLINATVVEHEGRPAILSINRDITAWKKQGEEIRNLNANLEELVQQRTAELERKNWELEQEVAQHKQTARALQESEERFRTLADSTPALIWMSGPNNEGLYFNKTWLNFTGRPLEQELGEGWIEMVHPEDRGAPLEVCKKAFKERKPFQTQFRLRRADGQYCWMLDTGTPLFTPDGALVGYIGSCIDITERKRMEEQLRSLNEKLEERVRERTSQVRALASALTLTEHRERHRFAQILHNDLQQLLYALQMQLHLLPRPQPPTDQALLAQISHALDRAIHVTRTLTVDLSPPVLKEEGLKEALIWLSSQMNDLYKLEVNLHSTTPVHNLNEDMRVLLFQIIRELLFNVVRHAEVSQVQVTLNRTAQYIHLQVKDEGVGFDTTAINKHRDNPDGFGLYNIRERLELLNGQMEIASAPGQGTSVDVIVPIKTSYQEAPVK